MSKDSLADEFEEILERNFRIQYSGLADLNRAVPELLQAVADSLPAEKKHGELYFWEAYHDNDEGAEGYAASYEEAQKHAKPYTYHRIQDVTPTYNLAIQDIKQLLKGDTK